MPLSFWVASQLQRIRAFLTDPHRILLELRGLPEQERMIARMLVSVAEDAEGIFAGVDGDFRDAAGLCNLIQEALADVLQQGSAVLAEDGRSLAVPVWWSEMDRANDPAREPNLALRGEWIARELYPWFDYVALVIRPRSAEQAAVTAAVLDRLCPGVGGGRLKFIVLINPACPLLPAVAAAPRARLTALTLAPQQSSRDALKAFASSSVSRVLVYDAPARGQTWMATELQWLAARSSRSVVVQSTGHPFWSPVYYYGRSAKQAVTECHRLAEGAGVGERLAPFLLEIANPHGRPQAEAHFVSLLERVVDAWLPSTATLIVLLLPDLGGPSPAGAAQAFVASLRRLAQAAVGTRIKFVAVGPGLELSPSQGAPYASQDMRLDGPVIQAGIEQRLAAPDVPPLERIRLTSALATFAVTRDDPAVALKLGVESLKLAHDTGSADEVAIAQFGLGGLLYRCAALDKAVRAYTASLEIALDRNNRGLAAHSLLGIGNCYFVIGQHGEALRAYNVARAYFRALGQPIAEGYALTWAGEAHVHLRQFDMAARLLREALACCDDATDGAEPSKMEILQRLAAVYAQVGLKTERDRALTQAKSVRTLVPVSLEP